MCRKHIAGVSAYGVVLMLLSSIAMAEAPATQQDDVKQLREQLKATEQRLAESESKLHDLSIVVEGLQRQMARLSGESVDKTAAAPQVAGNDYPATPPSEDLQLLNAKIEDHQQTKVESSSKFRLKLSGMLLLNVFGNAGFVDEIDMPRVAYPRPPAASD